MQATGYDDATAEGIYGVLDAAGADGVNHPAAGILPQYTRARRLLLSRKLLRLQQSDDVGTSTAIAARFLLPPAAPASVDELPELLHKPCADAPAGSSYLPLRRELLRRRFAGLHASVEDSILQRMATESMQRAMSAFREEQEVFHGGDSDASSQESQLDDVPHMSPARHAKARAAGWGVPPHMYDWSVAGRLGVVRSSGHGAGRRNRSDSALLPAQVTGQLSAASPAPGPGGAFSAAAGSGGATSAFGGVRGGGDSTQQASDMPTVDLEGLLARRYAGVTALAFAPCGGASMALSSNGAQVLQASARTTATMTHVTAVFSSVRGLLTFVSVPVGGGGGAAQGAHGRAQPRSRSQSEASSALEEGDVFGSMLSLGQASAAGVEGSSAFDSAAGSAGGATANRKQGHAADSDSDDEQLSSMTPKVWSTVAAHTSVITALDWSRDGSSLLSVGLDRAVRLWRVQPAADDKAGTGQVQQLRSIYRAELLTHAAFFPLNANMAVVAGITHVKPVASGPPGAGGGGKRSGFGAFFSSLGSSSATSAETQAAGGSRGDAAALGESGDTALQVTDKLYGVLLVLNLSTGKVAQTVPLPWPATCLTFAESGMQLFVGDLSGRVHVSTVPLDIKAQLQCPLGPLRCIVDLPALVATGGLGGTAGSALGSSNLFRAASSSALQLPCRVSHVGHLWRAVQRSAALMSRNHARSARSAGKFRAPQPLHGSCFFSLVHKPFDSNLRAPVLLACTDEGALLALSLHAAPPQVMQRLQQPKDKHETRPAGPLQAGSTAHASRSFRGASSTAAATHLPHANRPVGLLSQGGGSSSLVYAYVQPGYVGKRPRGDDCIFTCLAPCSGSDVLAAGTVGGEGMLLDPHARTITRTYVANLLAHACGVTCVAWGAGEQLVGTADSSGAVVMWRHPTPS